MIATVRGRFGSVQGSIDANEADPRSATVDVTVDVASIDTRQEQRIHRQLASFNRGPLSEKGLHELVGEILDLMKRELRGVDPEP